MPEDAFTPLFQESRSTIRARMDAEANAGLDDTDPARIDTREGSFFYEMTEPVVLELARLWDAISVEMPSTAFPTFAWGDYLDAHADSLLIERNAATFATGEARFAAASSGVSVPVGAIIVAPETDDTDALSFEVTTGGATLVGISTPTGLGATPSGSGGVLATDTYSYKVSATTAEGETLPTAAVTAAVTGPTGKVTLDWTDTAGASGYLVWRKATADTDHFFIATVTASTFEDTGASAPTSRVPSATNTTENAIVLPIQAIEPGAEGNLGPGAIDTLGTPLVGITVVTNPAALAGGADEQSDESLRDEILLALQSQGSGTAADYKRWVIEFGGVGDVWVEPAWAGAGTVRVFVLGEDGLPVNGSVVTAIQEYLDPAPGLGGGKAPIGAVVTVATPSITTVTVVASIEPLSGYSLDAEMQDAILARLTEYMASLAVGEDVVYDHVKACLFVTGVYAVSAVTVNGGTSNVTVAANVIARLDAAPTLTEV